MATFLDQTQNTSEMPCWGAYPSREERLAFDERKLAVKRDIPPREWDGIIEAFRDANLYQTREYEDAVWRYTRTERLAVFDRGEPVAATQVRVIELPRVKTGVAYVYRGPIWRPHDRPEHNPAGLCVAIKALHEEFVLKRRLLLRLLPDLTADEASHVNPVLEELGFAKRPAPPYRTFVLDLEPPMETLRKNLAHPWRGNLNKAERRNFDIAAGTSDDLYGEFLGLYEEMAARKNFDQRVDTRKFWLMQRRLPESRKMTVLVCRFEGKPVAAGVCAMIGETALQVFLATNLKALEVQGAYKLLWEQIRLLKESGVARYDLGGVDRIANPGGYQFKSGLAGKEVEFAGEYEACANALSRAVVHGRESIRIVVARQLASLRRFRSRDKARRAPE